MKKYIFLSVIALLIIVPVTTSNAFRNGPKKGYSADQSPDHYYSKAFKQQIAFSYKMASDLKSLLPLSMIKKCTRSEHGIKFVDKDKASQSYTDQCIDNMQLKQWSCDNYDQWIDGKTSNFPTFETKPCYADGGICIKDEQGGFDYCTSCYGENSSPLAGAEPSCSDGIQNQDEEGVDCGGPCTPCVPFCIVNNESPKKPSMLISECGIFINKCKEGADNVVVAYTCGDDAQFDHCKPPSSEVVCPVGLKCYDGVCAAPQQLCVDSDPNDGPSIPGEVYDSNHVAGKDHCTSDGALVQVKCKCPDEKQKTACAGGVISYVEYAAGSPEAAAACVMSEMGDCGGTACFNEKILMTIKCPTEICTLPVPEYTACPLNTTCIAGKCKPDIGYEEYTCNRTDDNGEAAGGGYATHDYSSLPSPWYDGCLTINTVYEKHCDGVKPPSGKSVDCPSGMVCNKENDTTPATCIPPLQQKTCERIDPLPEDGSPDEVGGGYALVVDEFGTVWLPKYDICLYSSDATKVREQICVDDGNGQTVATLQAKNCPPNHVCYQKYEKIPAICVPSSEGSCERTDPDGPENLGGGWISCKEVSGNDIIFKDECASWDQKKLIQHKCVGNDPWQCEKYATSEEFTCPPKYICKKTGDSPAKCEPKDPAYTCIRYEPSGDSNNPTAGFALLKTVFPDPDFPEIKVYDKCMSVDQIVKVKCPPGFASESTLIYEGADDPNSCPHSCISLAGTYPGNGYCQQ